MSRLTVLLLALVALVSAIPAALADGTKGSPSNPCATPSELGDSIEETAWRLWIAATCPVNKTQYPFVVWENWIEQAQMYPADPSKGLKVPNSGAPTATHILHSSPLAIAVDPSLEVIVPGLLGAPDARCNRAKAPPPGQPNLVLCEEVRLNGATEDYIAGTNLWNRAGQAQAAANGYDIQFARPAVEVKVDWILLDSIGIDCAHLPSEFARHPVHIETIHGHCFALAGMHVISKLIDKWIWATFEPQNSITNPNRCKYLPCVDPFGSTPAKSKGESTGLTKELEQLMDAANLAPEWRTYRLDGVQTDFSSPKLLGSSIIEGENVGVPAKQSSCITCHALSSVKSDGTDGITLLTRFPIKKPEPLPSDDWIRRDFVWSLSLACPGSRFQTCAP